MADVASCRLAEQWAARAAEAAENGGLCMVCMKYFGHTEGKCSVCCQFVLQEFGKPWEVIVSSASPEDLHAALGKHEVERESRASEDCRGTLDILDRATRQLAMQPQEFAHFLRTLPAELEPALLARRLLESGRPLLTAAQAAQMLSRLRAGGHNDYRFEHVLSSRVLDRWYVTRAEHNLGECYYGFHKGDRKCLAEQAAKLIGATERETLAALFLLLLRGRMAWVDGLPQWGTTRQGAFATENFWNEDDVTFVRAEMRDRMVDVVPDIVVTCQHADGWVVCSTMAGVQVGSFEVPVGSEPFGDWLSGQVCEAVPAKEGRLCLVGQDGSVLWQAEARPSPFEVVCRRLKAW